MNSRIAVLWIGIIFIGLFAMPTSLSLFSGQHTFKNATVTANEDSCRKCHEDVYEELHSAANTVHWNNPNDINDRFQCRECHDVTNVSYNFLGNNNDAGPNAVKRTDAHAATTVSCLACHGNPTWLAGYDVGAAQNPMHRLANRYLKGPGPPGALTWDATTCGQCHRDAENPGPDTFIYNVNSELTGSNAAHTDFYYQSKYPDNQTEIALKDANTACIGCHTHSGINITWVRSVGYNMSANLTTGSWNLSFSVNQTTINTTSAGN